jgi:hypothetical protein
MIRFSGFRALRAVRGRLTILLLAASNAASASVFQFVNDCDDPLDIVGIFDVNDPICVVGQFQSKLNFFDILPCGDVYLTANRSWTGGEFLVDALGSSQRTCNGDATGGSTVGTTAFFALVDLPNDPGGNPIGTYDVVLDENADGFYNAGIDAVWRVGTGAGFEIRNLGRPPINVAAIKAAAAGSSNRYNDIAKDTWNAIDRLDTILTNGSRLQNAAGALVDPGGAIAGTIATEVQNAYNSAVKARASEFFAGYDPATGQARGYLGQMSRKYADIAADPPDPDYQVLVALDVRAQNEALSDQGIASAFPMKVLGTDPLEATLVAIANTEVLHGAIADAYLASVEKYQGAEAASDEPWAWVQARMVRRYALLGSAILTRARGDYLAHKAALQAAGLATRVHDVSALQALIDRVNASGLTDTEVDLLEAAGYTSAQIDEVLGAFASATTSAADWTWNDRIDDLVADLDAQISAYDAIAADAQTVIDAIAAGITVVHPTAMPGGAYVATEGSAQALDGSASTDPQGAVSSYAWDTDLDGAFDDATGSTPSVLYSDEQAGYVGLRVTDADGNVDVAYAVIDVAEADLEPVVTAARPDPDVPLELVPGASRTLSVTANDPEASALAYVWRVDGTTVPAETSSSFTYVRGADGRTEPFFVDVVVSDGNGLSEDVVQGWIVIPTTVAPTQVPALPVLASLAGVLGTGAMARWLLARRRRRARAGTPWRD